MTGFILFAVLMAACLFAVFEMQYRGRNGLALGLFACGLAFAMAAGQAADRAAMKSARTHEARP